MPESHAEPIAIPKVLRSMLKLWEILLNRPETCLILYLMDVGRGPVCSGNARFRAIEKCEIFLGSYRQTGRRNNWQAILTVQQSVFSMASSRRARTANKDFVIRPRKPR